MTHSAAILGSSSPHPGGGTVSLSGQLAPEWEQFVTELPGRTWLERWTWETRTNDLCHHNFRSKPQNAWVMKLPGDLPTWPSAWTDQPGLQASLLLGGSSEANAAALRKNETAIGNSLQKEELEGPIWRGV